MSISAQDVKKLREITGAGMMNCKKALQETNGNIDEAVDFLRKSGAALAAKKASRDTNEGAVYAYIHPGSKVGVMVEINCETDFVARNPEFTGLCKDIAMHIAAMSPKYVSIESVPEETVAKEKEILAAQVLETGKPANIVDKIVEGRIKKFFEDSCLLEQTFVKDSDKKIKDVLIEAIAKLGENMTVGRFIRYKIGEE